MAATTNSGQPDEPVPVEGTPLGSGYVLLRAIGEGAYGRVWSGRRRSDSAAVAIKVMRSEYLTDPDVLGRFLRERTVLMDLDHPHLVRVEDLVVEGETVAVVMQLVDGVDLRQVFRRGKLDLDDALTVLAQVSAGLAYIHANGTLHRDIKPENILVTERDGRPYALLADFGLAWVSDGQTLTQASHVPGTPAYLAPEQLTGRPYGPEVDIYALGVTAYELLSGRRPFHGENALALMRAQLDDEPRRPEGMPAAQWRIIRACLVKTPKERPTAATLAQLFEDLRQGGDTVGGGIDFGTSAAAAVVWWPNGQFEPLLFDGSARLPCAVFLDSDGTLRAGRSAIDAGGQHPQHCEPYPKLRAADSVVRLGDRDVEPVDLVAAVLRRVTEQVRQRAGPALPRITITHPGSWSQDQARLLADAAHRAGLPRPRLVTEAIATAAHCVSVPTKVVPPGAYALICDLGAATTATTVVRRTADGGFEVVAGEQAPDSGGIDIDSAILAHLGGSIDARAPQVWQRLSKPASLPDHRAAWRLWREVQQAKEMLSETTTVTVRIPLLDETLPLRRDEVERLAMAVLERTVALARTALATAGIAPDDVAATLLVGGVSRMPAAAALLREAFGHPPILVPQPALVVADGAAHLTPVRPPASGSADTNASDARDRRAVRSTRRGRRAAVDHSRSDDPPPVLSQTGPGLRRGNRGSRRAGRRRRLRLAVVVGLLALASAGLVVYTSSAQSGPHSVGGATCGYKIGFLGQPSGPSGFPAFYNATRLAVDRYNTAHATCTVQLVVLNTGPGTGPGAAEQAAAAVADHRILGIIGPMTEAEGPQELPILDSGRLATLSPSPWLSETGQYHLGSQVFHRTVGTELDDTVAGARQIVEGFNASHTFVINGYTSGAVGASAEMRRQLGAERLAGTATITNPNANPAALVNEVVNSTATAIYYAGTATAFAPVLKALRAVKPGLTVMIDIYAFTDALYSLAGAAAVGTYATCPCAPPVRTGQNFATTFRSRFDTDATICTGEAYDAANVLLDGLANGIDSRSRMLDWVAGYDRTGVSGRIKFNSDGRLVNSAVSLWQMTRGGHFDLVGMTPGGQVSR